MFGYEEFGEVKGWPKMSSKLAC